MLNPLMDDAGVLPGREVRLSPQTAREEVSALAGAQMGSPLANSAARLLGDFELHRPAGLALAHPRSVPDPSAREHVIDLQPPRSQPLSLPSITSTPFPNF